jgi:hypothetical protein
VAPSSSEQIFAAWVPTDVIWSEWAKPVAFVHAGDVSRDEPAPVEPPPLPMTLDSASAVVVDLPGAEAVQVGLQLAERGFCPVPLFNGTSGPSPVVDVLAIARALAGGAERLRRRAVLPHAAPAFLLDAHRSGTAASLKPGAYDNRWVTLPQDFPSGALLASRGFRSATLIQRGGTSIKPDLAHVLRRWQDQGIALRVADIATGQITEVGTLPAPSRFRLAWYAAVALLGLRRNNVGGFGSAIPEQTSGGGYYG